MSSGQSDGGRDRIELSGPWEHRYVAAHGARFHVAICGAGPAVLLLHGFPQFWWAWRHQLPVLADAGYQAIAMDLRGYGGSDKTPRGYDPFTLAGDVAGVIKALGLGDAVVVGAGWGGYVAWTTATVHPEQTRALAVVSAPHPAYLMRDLRPRRRAVAHLLGAQIPWRPERRLADSRTGYLEHQLRGWSSTPGFPSPTELAAYQDALRLWPAPHCALEYHRWLVRSRVRADGRAFNQAMRTPVGVPVLNLRGGADPALPHPRRDRSGAHVSASYRLQILPRCGHFVAEEQPEEFTGRLLDWLRAP